MAISGVTSLVCVAAIVADCMPVDLVSNGANAGTPACTESSILMSVGVGWIGIGIVGL